MGEPGTPADDLVAAGERSRAGGGVGSRGPERQIIIFAAGGREFALPIESVERTESLPAVTPVPRVPLFVRGMGSLRGGIVCILDLHQLLGGDAAGQGEEARSLLIVQDRGRRVGVQSASLPDFIRVRAADLMAPPDAAEDLYAAAIERGAGVVGVIDPSRLFDLIERRLHG